MTHSIPLPPTLFEPTFVGLRTALVLPAEPLIEHGDHLVLQEFVPSRGLYTGRWVRAQATFVEHVDRGARQIVSIRGTARSAGEPIARRPAA